MIGVGPDGNDSIQAYNTYHLVSSSTSIPVMQEIDIAKDDDGQMTITTERDCFDVIASDDIYYGLELKYYDQNGMLINHQFSGYPFMKDKDGYNVPDEDNATLLVHQHFFGIGNASLNKAVADSSSAGHGQEVRGLQMAYPRSLASLPTYYDRYTSRSKGELWMQLQSSLLLTSMCLTATRSALTRYRLTVNWLGKRLRYRVSQRLCSLLPLVGRLIISTRLLIQWS